METHLSGEKGHKVREKLRFDGSFVEEARGFAGGKDLNPWLLTAIYGSPQKVASRDLWCNLGLAPVSNLPWCLIGTLMLSSMIMKGKEVPLLTLIALALTSRVVFFIAVFSILAIRDGLLPGSATP
ncbi:hypothetical protein PIB30_068114 [Stylosanthes scabra]|uniref:Uncharacterized protein n=1 Tax=Stylosanthes scabra TaxID=79078 RepID=A0ABU6QMC3_9FABA|nr:hypothetical protein [Stylosanthes scabra]